MLSPKEASAEIRTDRQTATILNNARQQSTLWNKIISKAQEAQQVTHIKQQPGLSFEHNNAGQYNPRDHTIEYDPELGSADDQQGTLVHELLHFLNGISGAPVGVDQSHEVIRTLLGTDSYTPAAKLRSYQRPPYTPPEQEAIIKSWFGE